MKIASEKQLEYIKTDFKDLVASRISEYSFDGIDLPLFENLILYFDDILFNKIREEHYLAMTDCQRLWNKYFWYLRYSSDVLKNGKNNANNPQLIAKMLEQLYNTCSQVDDLTIEPFSNFASNFEQQEYILFDYFHPCITDSGISIRSPELLEIASILGIDDFDIAKLDKLIERNIDNEQADLLTFKNKKDTNSILSIDTFSASADQIHPVDIIIIKCEFEQKDKVDQLLVSWWSKYWKKMGPFVAISNVNKFDTDPFFKKRKRVEQ